MRSGDLCEGREHRRDPFWCRISHVADPEDAFGKCSEAAGKREAPEPHVTKHVGYQLPSGGNEG